VVRVVLRIVHPADAVDRKMILRELEGKGYVCRERVVKDLLPWIECTKKINEIQEERVVLL
jgi:repressor of nif and glnA expression